MNTEALHAALRPAQGQKEDAYSRGDDFLPILVSHLPSGEVVIHGLALDKEDIPRTVRMIALNERPAQMYLVQDARFLTYPVDTSEDEIQTEDFATNPASVDCILALGVDTESVGHAMIEYRIGDAGEIVWGEPTDMAGKGAGLFHDTFEQIRPFLSEAA